MTPADYHGCGTWLEGHIPIFSFFGHPGAAREASEALASTVLEVKNPRSEFRLEIKILLYKSTPGNTKMTLEFELDTKQNIFISKIPDRLIDSRKMIGFTNKNVIFGVQIKF